MRTTLEIPDDLFRAAKQTALARDCTLRELFTDALVHELKGQARGAKPTRHPLPSIKLPADAPILSMSPAALAEADLQEEASRHAAMRH
jgi:hypothetical protein